MLSKLPGSQCNSGRPTTRSHSVAICVAMLFFMAPAWAQKPVAELPRVHIDTAWKEPAGGKTWQAHTAEEFSNALAKSAPGDVIVLDAGATYVGNFALPAKDNPEKKWIYVESSALAKLPAGKRVSPDDAAQMPKIVTPNVSPSLQINSAANHWRLAGLEVTSASTQGCQPNHLPKAINCFTYILVGPSGNTAVEPDSFTIDRCYIHASPTIDIQHAIVGNESNLAVVDSYISDIHLYGAEAQGILAYTTPGPIKIVNNYIEAATENILFGGAGGPNNPYVASDVEVRNNYLFKPLSWVGDPSKVIKNHFEVKSGQRFIVDGNTMENVWLNGQNGFSIVLTVRSAQSGDVTVINDITVTNNILKNVAAGFNTLAKDDACGSASYARCKNAGSQARWYIANNLITFRDPTLPGGIRNLALQVNGGVDRMTTPPTVGVLRDVVFQHNTTVSAASTSCWNSIIFNSAPARPPYAELTNNIWILDNVLCRQPTGDFGLQGGSGLMQYMGASTAPSRDLDKRFSGNVMFVPPADKVQSFPPHNLSTTKPFQFVDPAKGNYDLLQPKWTQTSDGKLAGVDSSALPQ